MVPGDPRDGAALASAQRRRPSWGTNGRQGGKVRRIIITIVAGLLFVLCLCDASGVEDPVVLTAGDIADCGLDGRLLTARILAQEAGAIVAIGDLVYPAGSAKGFAACYAPSWGALQATHLSGTRQS
jgi:hypothetical protein